MEAGRKKIVFFGNERLATGVTTTAPTLRGLVEAGYDVVAVVSHYERGTSRNVRELEIAAVAEELGIPLLLPERPADIIDELIAFQADIGVLAAYGKIVPQRVIDIFPWGIANIHPSLLPLHRGPTPIESIILAGELETGVSIMQLVKAMDAGPVYDQTNVLLTGKETKQELADLLLGHGKNMLLEALPGILDGSMPPRVQDEDNATYDALITKDSGTLDFTKPAFQLEREIRAYAGWPKSRTILGGKEVIITRARSADLEALPDHQGKPFATPEGHIAIPTSSGHLIIESLKPAGKQEMTSAAFLAGYQL